ncbi:nuclear transport factor 2 family protein [Frankia sp. CNm7]|uniref:Nuclear transport factor 2 family protein n=1 Tax=Frankia nepalensis TaxID=1836974 RepID=A0A937UQ08_9ACTN|nr:nuclear transport factor 2 family protein [Frankia nepalensis]MBL7502273.1 nuclear transport factor 2 family protein [Frankia nepalensis]MBL7516352.1 nuclear transport factor 2 family protein [Frankia nepalensis]MBL7519398.1 nuclear transport factor 2 family protein [Frankia nepalensis]MBL7631394.1 nuclear transport factor 2 family protein [Frankia nepalensis]
MRVEDLCEIEAIKQLKARYLRLVDEKKWDEWADVFVPDLDAWIEDVPDERFTSREEFIAFIQLAIGAGLTVHHGHMPEIEITGPDTARGTWAMNDYVRFAGPDGMLEIDGCGHYREEYRRCADGRWRISRLRITRLLGMVDELRRRGVVEEPAVVIPSSRGSGSPEGLVAR